MVKVLEELEVSGPETRGVAVVLDGRQEANCLLSRETVGVGAGEVDDGAVDIERTKKSAYARRT